MCVILCGVGMWFVGCVYVSLLVCLIDCLIVRQFSMFVCVFVSECVGLPDCLIASLVGLRVVVFCVCV